MNKGSGVARLTTRELEILQWLAYGKTMEIIAELLSTTPATIHMTITRLKNKLGAGTTTGAVCIAMRHGKIK